MQRQTQVLKQKQDSSNVLSFDNIDSSSNSSKDNDQKYKNDYFPNQYKKSILTRSFSTPKNNHEVSPQLNESDEEVYCLLKEEQQLDRCSQLETQIQEMQSPILIKIESYDQKGQVEGQPFYMLRDNFEVRQNTIELTSQILVENQKSQTKIEEYDVNVTTLRKYFIEESGEEGQFYLEANRSSMYLMSFSKQSILINFANVEEIFDLFIQKQTVIPIINSQMFTAQYKCEFWILYFRFLVNTYRDIFREVIKAMLNKKKEKKQKKQKSKITSIIYESGAELRDNLSSLFDLSFCNFYSKPKILKDFCISKLSFLKQFDCEKHEIASQKKELHKELAVLEMTEGFENSFYFCQKNLRKSKYKICETNWKEMKDRIEKEKKNWLREHSNTMIMI